MKNSSTKKSWKTERKGRSYEIRKCAGGNADPRLKTAEALKSLKTFDIERAKQQLLDANEDIVAAHQSQTASLQAESNGEEIEYSILFTHAQDTCMTVCSEINIAQQLVDICEAIDERFKKLEK